MNSTQKTPSDIQVQKTRNKYPSYTQTQVQRAKNK